MPPINAKEGSEDLGKTLIQIASDILTQETDERNNGDLLKEHGLKLVHIRPNNDFVGRGMTIAYKETNKNVIEISTAIVHTNDTFCKKVGGRIAIENFIAGRTVYIRKIFKGENSVTSIKALFGF